MIIIMVLINLELGKIPEWLRANKPPSKEDKTIFTLFHKPKDRDNLPLQLPALEINDHEIKQILVVWSINILVVLILLIL